MRNLYRSILIGAGLAIALSSPALAGYPQWVEVAQSEQGDKLFVDLGNIRVYNRMRPASIQYLTTILYSRPFRGASKFVATYVAYCETRSQRADAFATYNQAGQIIDSAIFGSNNSTGNYKGVRAPFEPVGEGTLEEAAFDYACSHSKIVY